MAKITGMLAANIPRQFFFVIITTASTRCLVEKGMSGVPRKAHYLFSFLVFKWIGC